MIFSKRNVHRMLNAVAPNLELVRVKDLEGKLATETDQTRPAEWEVAIAYALSQVGLLKDFGNSKAGNPDFIWEINGNTFVVEVTSVSDNSFHNLNPVEYFTKELHRKLRKLHVSDIGRLSYDFGSIEQDNKIIIGIPEKRNTESFFNSLDFVEFTNKIKSSPDKSHSLHFNARGSNSLISYYAGTGYFTGGHRSYTSPQNYRHSPIYNCLRSKETQIRKSETTLPAILVICDNDCDALRPSIGGSIGRVSMKDIVGLFLNGQQQQSSGDFIWQEGIPAQGRRIHAVVWITVHQPFRILETRKQPELNINIEFASYAAPNVRCQEFLNALSTAFNTLPSPLRTPKNANTENRKHPPYYGGYEMSGHSVKFSALTLQKLLTGEISHSEFQKDHVELVKLLKRITEEGRMLSDAQLDVSLNNDDDWIKLDFNNINPEHIFTKSKISK